MKNLKKVLLLLGVIFCFQLGFAKGEDLSQVKLKDINGVEYSFGDIKQKSYVKLWASWCHYCTIGLPDLDKLSEEEKDFEVVSVVFPDQSGEMNKEDFIKWYKSLGYKNIKVLLDEDGEILKYVNLRAYPTSVFLDKDANIKMVIPGAKDNKKIRKMMKNIK